MSPNKRPFALPKMDTNCDYSFVYTYLWIAMIQIVLSVIYHKFEALFYIIITFYHARNFSKAAAVATVSKRQMHDSGQSEP